jgi:hypothetical protein
MKSGYPHAICLGLALLGALAAPGCVVGNDSDPPELNVDLFWDRAPQGDRFSGSTCAGAGVVWMDWKLTQGDEEIATSDEGGVDCEDGFRYPDLTSGTYELSVVGYDKDEQALWNGVCEGLELERFDVLYQCQIDQTEPAEADAKLP